MTFFPWPKLHPTNDFTTLDWKQCLLYCNLKKQSKTKKPLYGISIGNGTFERLLQRFEVIFHGFFFNFKVLFKDYPSKSLLYPGGNLTSTAFPVPCMKMPADLSHSSSCSARFMSWRPSWFMSLLEGATEQCHPSQSLLGKPWYPSPYFERVDLHAGEHKAKFHSIWSFRP